MEWFKHSIEEARSRLYHLSPTTTGPNTDNGGLVPMLLEELTVALEELQVTGEEMHQQNDALVEAQYSLVEARQRYQDLFDFAPDPYLITDQHGYIQEANRAAQDMFGISARRLVGKPLAVYIAAAGRPAFRSFLESCQYTETTCYFETTIRPRSRGAFPAALSVGASRDAARNVVAMRWLVRDVTERHHWEQMLRDANQDLEMRVRERTQELETARERISEILESITDAFYALDPNYCFTFVNHTAEKLWGRPRAEFLGRRFSEIEPRVADPAWLEAHERVMVERTPARCEAEAPEGKGWIEAHIYPTGGGGISVYCRDISDRKEVDAERRRKMEHDHRIADTLQSNLMQPVPEDRVSGLRIATLYQAASEEALIGGDFYDVFMVGEGKTALVVGDVSGKGLAAAAHIAEVKYGLRAFLRETAEPGVALTRLNDTLCAAQMQEDWGDASLVVLALVLLDSATGEARYASAGAEPLIVTNADGQLIKEYGRSSGLVLGVSAGRDYQETVLTLEPGGMLLMATDGITEARRGGEMFGFDGLKAHVRRTVHLDSVHEIVRRILDEARQFSGGALTDDACLLLVRRLPS